MTEPKHDLARLRGKKIKMGKASFAMPQVKFQNTEPQQFVFLGFASFKTRRIADKHCFPEPGKYRKNEMWLGFGVLDRKVRRLTL